MLPSPFHFFFFNDTATTEIYTLSLHDALPICIMGGAGSAVAESLQAAGITRQLLQLGLPDEFIEQDRKSTRLNSSHSQISYAVFCLKKKKNSMARRIALQTPVVRSSTSQSRAY